jgi:hypothetical protein
VRPAEREGGEATDRWTSRGARLASAGAPRVVRGLQGSLGVRGLGKEWRRDAARGLER